MVAPCICKSIVLSVCLLVTSAEVRAQSQKEILATLNRVSDQLIRGNVNALDDVKALLPTMMSERS